MTLGSTTFILVIVVLISIQVTTDAWWFRIRLPRLPKTRARTTTVSPTTVSQPRVSEPKKVVLCRRLCSMFWDGSSWKFNCKLTCGRRKRSISKHVRPLELDYKAWMAPCERPILNYDCFLLANDVPDDKDSQTAFDMADTTPSDGVISLKEFREAPYLFEGEEAGAPLGLQIAAAIMRNGGKVEGLGENRNDDSGQDTSNNHNNNKNNKNNKNNNNNSNKNNKNNNNNGGQEKRELDTLKELKDLLDEIEGDLKD